MKALDLLPWLAMLANVSVSYTPQTTDIFSVADMLEMSSRHFGGMVQAWVGQKLLKCDIILSVFLMSDLINI